MTANLDNVNSLADLQNIELPADAETPKVEASAAPAKKAATEKSKTRKIRSSVYAWFEELTNGLDAAASEAKLKTITPDAFLAFVLDVDPAWKIADKGEKVVKNHVSWYRSNFKKPETKKMLADKKAASLAAQIAATTPAQPPLIVEPTQPAA